MNPHGAHQVGWLTTFAFGGIVAVTDNSQSSATEILVSAESGAIACSGADGDILYFQISRDANNGSDTMSADARLVGVKIFFRASWIR